MQVIILLGLWVKTNGQAPPNTVNADPDAVL